MPFRMDANTKRENGAHRLRNLLQSLICIQLKLSGQLIVSMKVCSAVCYHLKILLRVNKRERNEIFLLRIVLRLA